MGERVKERRRAKVSTTVDAELLHMVDRFVAEHADTNRGMVFDEALRLWAARERERAIEAQHTAPPSPQEREEYAASNQIRRSDSARQLPQECWGLSTTQ